MATIPDITDLGAPRIPRTARGIVSDQSAQISAEATANFAGSVANIADRLDQEGQELARAKDANNYVNHQLAVKTLEQSYKDKIASGEIPYGDAQQRFMEDAAKLPTPKPIARGALAAENLKTGIDRTIKGAAFNVGLYSSAARDNDLRSQGALQLDSLGKLASLPDANIDSINKQADLVAPLLRQSGLNEAQVTKTLQDFKDRNWLNQATQRAMQSRESLPALKQMEHDLTAADGFYIGKLDTDKRNSVLNAVITHRITLENRLQHEADRRDAKGLRAVNEIERQIASTVPATEDQWAQWETLTKGTIAEPDFKELRANELEVQQLVRKPIDEQLKYVQDKQSALLSGGGSIREAANVQRLANAVQKNVQLLQTSPLQFNAARNGVDVPPLDFSNQDAAAAQIKDRIATLTAMRKQYGNAVPMRPLLPQEAQQLASHLQTVDPHEATAAFAQLYNAMGSNEAYVGAMNQIAPDSPVAAHAGLLAAQQAQLTTKTHWFKPDESVTNADVAATMLQGERLINPTKAEKGADGKPKLSLYLPETKSLQDEFSSEVGTAFAGSPQAMETAFQAVKAYYVGRAEQKGTIAAGTSGKADSDLVREAVKSVLGNVVNYNGRGDVIAPWGMSESGFKDRVPLAFSEELKKRGMDQSLMNILPSLGLKNYGDGTYQLTQGESPLLDKKGAPIILNLNAPIEYTVEVPKSRAEGGGYRIERRVQ